MNQINSPSLIPASGFTVENLRACAHWSQKRNFAIAACASIPVALIVLAVVVSTWGLIAIFAAGVWLMLWLASNYIRAVLVGGAVKVSEENFPEIHSIYEKVRQVLGYHKDVDIFIIEEGTVNAVLWKLVGRKCLVLNSQAVEGMSGANRADMEWLIARFLGSMKAKFIDFHWILVIVESIEKLKFLNLFILPYLRSLQYSGDQVGLILGGDLKAAISALRKSMVGIALGPVVSDVGIAYQSRALRGSFFGWLATIVSDYPAMVDRHVNLLRFAKEHMPDQWEELLAEKSPGERRAIEVLLAS